MGIYLVLCVDIALFLAVCIVLKSREILQLQSFYILLVVLMVGRLVQTQITNKYSC